MRGLRHLQGGGGCDVEQMRAIRKTQGGPEHRGEWRCAGWGTIVL